MRDRELGWVSETPVDPRRAQVEEAMRSSASEALRVAASLDLRDENWLTDLIFGARHPERRGRRLQRGETALAREWLDIRSGMVRPALTPGTLARRAAPGPTPRPAVAPAAPPCPVEDPFPPSLHKPGTQCGPDGRKCWPKEGWLDIVDPDMPCNDESRRSPASYSAVLDYFNVAHPSNARYTPGGATYCNIYVHDVTRAMRASIPHWIKDPAQTSSKPLGWRELSANATFDWLRGSGRQAGWRLLDPAFVAWIAAMNARKQSVAQDAPTASRGVASAASRIAAQPHDAALLWQDAYLAQQFANLGLPVVIAWRNPRPGSGHVAMVRPETPNARGAREPRSGLYVPISAQAGRQNFELRPAHWIAQPAFLSREIYVHA